MGRVSRPSVGIATNPSTESTAMATGAARIQNDRSRRGKSIGLPDAKESTQTRDWDDGSAKVRQTQQRERRARHSRDRGNPDHLGDFLRRQRIETLIHTERQEAERTRAGHRAELAPCRFNSSANEAISSIAAARSSAPRACSVEAVAA